MDVINPSDWMQDLKRGAFCMVCGEYTAINDPEGTLCRNRYSVSHAEIWELMKVLFMIQENLHGKTDYARHEIMQISLRARKLIGAFEEEKRR